jgi:hypothetical protein
LEAQLATLTETQQQVKELVAGWRVKGAHCDAFHATMGIDYKACADDLDALLTQSETKE